MRSTLTLLAAAFALFMGMLAPETVWAKKKQTIAYSHDDWNVGSMVSGAYGDSKTKPAYLPGGHSGSGSGDITEVFAALGMLCKMGGAGLTVASFIGGSAAAFAAGPAGWGVGGVCLIQQFVGLGMPPPKPIIVNGPSKSVVINIDMNDPKVQEFFNKHPEALQKLQQGIQKPPQVPSKGADVPVAQAPEVPQKKTAEAPPTQSVPPAAQTGQVPQKKAAEVPATKQVPSTDKKSSTPAVQKPTPKIPKDPLTQQEAKAPVPYTVINANR